MYIHIYNLDKCSAGKYFHHKSNRQLSVKDCFEKEFSMKNCKIVYTKKTVFNFFAFCKIRTKADICLVNN